MIGITEKPESPQVKKKEQIDYAKPPKEPNLLAIGGMVAIVVLVLIILLAVTVDWST